MNKLKIGLRIIEILNKNSYEAYLVGGAVRDFIRNEEIHDVDITTNALPKDIERIFSKVTLEGHDYLSCRVHIDGQTFELTTFRKEEGYVDHRHPIAIPAETLEEDLARRDFTMNAIAMNCDKTLIDPFDGEKDIIEKRIRVIGDPHQRFNEDGLRVLRALDFASRFNFQLDEAIIKSFSRDYIGFLKEEYIIEMIDKIVHRPYSCGLQYIVKYQLLKSFPFYQVLCEEIQRYHYNECIYALFYTLHNFLPSDIKISSHIRAQAQEIAYLVRNDFNDIALYYGSKVWLLEAIILYNKIYTSTISLLEITQRIDALPIHSSKELCMDWTKVLSKDRAAVTKKLERAVLCKKVKNEAAALRKYLETEE